MDRYDVAIIGGGPAGASLAALLAQDGWSVAVFEKAEFPRRKVCGEFLSASNAPILARLGVVDAFSAAAGPPVREVGLFVGDATLTAPMPRAADPAGWGRALGRETLDTLLLRRAAALGACVRQPWSVTALRRDGASFVGTAQATGGQARGFAARIVVAAHGSWEPGPLPTQAPRRAHRARDLIGFKAHFRDGALAPGLMPLLVFPGGYGGLVASDDGRMSFSCCIRRDVLAALRREYPGLRAGEAVVAHAEATNRGLRQALRGATLAGAVLSAGPIRPGFRPLFEHGIFRIGNAAGEAHPVIAEGISMALQSAALLADAFAVQRREGAGRDRAAREYRRRWRATFAPRILAAAAVAQLALRPALAGAMRRAVALWPRLLTVGAAVSGKVKAV